MTTPQVDIDQLRRQFPEEVVRYFDAVVAAKFSVIDSQIAALQQVVAGLAEQINSAAQQAANQAEARFVQQALADLANSLKPYVSAQISEEIGTQVEDTVETELKKWVYNSRTNARYKFYIDSEANIEALASRENQMIYIGTETQPVEVPEFSKPWDLSTDV